MGKVMSAFTRPLKTFNIETRAHKVISRDKPIPAPTYKSTERQLEVAKSTNPTFMEEHYKKDAKLDDRLKNVYVSSKDVPVPETEANPDRPLPKLTRRANDFEYGFWEPEHASEGHCTLRTALSVMTEHMNDPEKNSAQEMAKKYKLDEKDVSHLLEYFRVYKVVIPERPEDDFSSDTIRIPAEARKQVPKK